MGKFLPSGRDPYAALRIRDFSFFLTARFFLTLGVQVQSVTVGIQIYNLTKDPLAVGMIGLTEAVPFLLFSLIGGYIADIVRRKFILIIATAFLLIASWSLFIVSQDGGLIDRFGPDSYRVWPIYGIIFCTGIARGFLGPVFPSFLAQLVPRTHLANAATWQSNLFQTALVTGPIIAGLIIAGLDLNYAYFTACGLMSVAFLVMLMVSNLPVPPRLEKEPLARSLTSGFRFVFSNQIMLSAFTLDLFAVLFGGAVAMIPFFANEVLHGGENAERMIGFLRAAPGIGAIMMGIVLTFLPPTRHAGRNLYIAVTGFGLGIIAFSLSDNFYLSFIILVICGVFDQVSVVIRGTILQLLTPDHMRGRVAAVNGIFIGSSNEIGEFESGVAARLLGLIPSVIFGGSMTILVVIAVMIFAPKLRKLDLDKMI